MITRLKSFYDFLDREYASHMRVFRYVISGGTAAATNIGFLYLFTGVFGIWYVLSSVMSFVLAFGISFTFQKYWTFKDHSTEAVVTQGASYFIVSIVNLGLNTLLIYLLTDFAGIFYILSQIIAGIAIAVESYFVYRHVIFRSAKASPLSEPSRERTDLP